MKSLKIILPVLILASFAFASDAEESASIYTQIIDWYNSNLN